MFKAIIRWLLALPHLLISLFFEFVFWISILAIAIFFLSPKCSSRNAEKNIEKRRLETLREAGKVLSLKESEELCYNQIALDEDKDKLSMNMVIRGLIPVINKASRRNKTYSKKWMIEKDHNLKTITFNDYLIKEKGYNYKRPGCIHKENTDMYYTPSFLLNGEMVIIEEKLNTGAVSKTIFCNLELKEYKLKDKIYSKREKSGNTYKIEMNLPYIKKVVGINEGEAHQFFHKSSHTLISVDYMNWGTLTFNDKVLRLTDIIDLEWLLGKN